MISSYAIFICLLLVTFEEFLLSALFFPFMGDTPSISLCVVYPDVTLHSTTNVYQFITKS